MSGSISPEARGLKPLRLQTSFQRPSSAVDNGTPTAPPRTNTGSTNNFQTPPTANGTPETRFQNQNSTAHQRFVLTDPLAFRYLEDDLTTKVIERRAELRGYECYIVEQWTTSRSHPTFTITTYTGDLSHTVVVGVLSVPTDERAWSPRLRVYFKALNQYHARRRETSLGILMVTNLSGFPSSLTVIAVPDGDLKAHRPDFFVNEDLKRLNCSGRVGLTLTPPSAATVAKFHQLYRTSDKNEIYHSVIELVKLCQSALMLFDKLEIDYADGLLCDVTERAINDWWLEIGSSYFNIEPHDGILGPTTVASLLGLLMGARNRLHSVGAPVGKDAFDVEVMKKGIGAFQKQQRLVRSRRLDRKTLDRLHRATAKAANSEGYWGVPKAVKSTVAELSGKGGEMVMDVVGRRDRAGIAEIETCEIERFVQLVYGERPRWLWYGKPLKKSAHKGVVGQPLRVGDEALGVTGKDLVFAQDNQGGYTWTAKKSTVDGMPGAPSRRQADQEEELEEQEGDQEGEDGIKGALKRTSGFKEARSGLDRFKGAVGLGSGHHGHSHKHTASRDVALKDSAKYKEGSPQTPRSPLSPRLPQSPIEESPATPANGQIARPPIRRARSSPVSNASNPHSPVKERMEQRFPTESIPEHQDFAPDAAPAYAASFRQVGTKTSRESFQPPPSYMSREPNGDRAWNAATSDQGSENVTIDAPSVAGGSVYNTEGEDVTEGTDAEKDVERDDGRLLKRTNSDSQFVTTRLQSRSVEGYPRHLSFSLAEESVLIWEDIVDSERDTHTNNTRGQMMDEEFIAKESRHLRKLIYDLETTTTPFTQSQLETLHTLLSTLASDQQTLESLYHPHEDHLQSLRTASEDVLRAEKERLDESLKGIETLAAKLEYEVNGLKGRVEDVDAGVGDFEKGVGRVEERVGELERDAAKAEQGWNCAIQ